MAKGTIIRTEQQLTKWEKILTNYISARGLIIKIYKELKNMNIKKTTQLKINNGEQT